MPYMAYARNYFKKELITISKKMGRPTDDPKTHVARLRLSDIEYQKLIKCCELTGENITNVLKMWI